MKDSLNLEDLCHNCVDIAREAGNKILDIYNSDYTIVEKEDNSPLTDADIAAHDIIMDALSTLTPQIPILSEESTTPPYDIRNKWHTYWLVDPIDGTREFIKRNGEFTVNIALIHNHRSILGVVHVPVTNTVYFAWQDGGCYKSKNGENSHKIAVKKLDSDKLIVTSSRSHGSKLMQSYMKNIGDVDLLCMGSSLKLCMVAEGKADLYPRLGPTSEWDTAAAHCIVEQAGGFLTKTDMSALEYNTKDSLLNPFFFVFGDNSTDWSQYLDSN